MTRIEILEAALKHIDGKERACICLTIDHYTGDGNTFKHFPELLAYKPSGRSDWMSWWPYDKEGNARRVEVLKELIEKLK